jgi:hypothetical protein
LALYLGFLLIVFKMVFNSGPGKRAYAVYHTPQISGPDRGLGKTPSCRYFLPADLVTFDI